MGDTLTAETCPIPPCMERVRDESVGNVHDWLVFKLPTRNRREAEK